MSYLYVTEHGAEINVDGGYFVVKHKDGMLHKVPKETLESVALFGNVSVTTPCIKQFLQKGIAVSYFSPKGAYFGRLESTRHKNIKRLKKQFKKTEDEFFCLELARKIVYAKINNQVVVLRRYDRHRNINIASEISMMKMSMQRLDEVTTIDGLRGFEGIAAKSYFKAISHLIDPKFEFKGRNRMPPKDPFNSLLSLGYTLLMYEIYGEIENKGLSPYAGFFHQDAERHPTLASDLMEEWRAVIVDSVILSLIQGQEISVDCFHKDDETGGVFIDNTGMKIFLNKMENKLRSETGYIQSTYKMSFRKALWHQVNQLTSAIENNDVDMYNPILIR